MSVNAKQIRCILKVLYNAGLRPKFYKMAASGSAYIKFGTNIGGSLRISNHPQRARYAYSWNLQSDILSILHKEKLGHTCHYYPFADFEVMVGDMLKEWQERENLQIDVKTSLNFILSRLK